MSARACIFGCAGPHLSADEKRFFADAQPWGFVLFARNLQTEDQIRALCNDVRDCVGANAPIFIDEEGGRVSRLRTIGGRIGPPANIFGQSAISEADMCAAVRANYFAIGARLAALGIDVDFAPVLDLPNSNADPIISDRAFSTEPQTAAVLGAACLEGLNAAGVSGVIKHMPGHGRADVDSHMALPVVTSPKDVLEMHDFLPFKTLKNAPMAMTAHVIYSAYDPEHTATTSKIVIKDVIRGQIGFDGLLMSDDIDMKALSGSLAMRAENALKAGCDVVLHCDGVLEKMRQIAEVTPLLQGRALARANAARAHAAKPAPGIATAQTAADEWVARLQRGAG